VTNGTGEPTLFFVSKKDAETGFDVLKDNFPLN
jgi:hypothetical protein